MLTRFPKPSNIPGLTITGPLTDERASAILSNAIGILDAAAKHKSPIRQPGISDAGATARLADLSRRLDEWDRQTFGPPSVPPRRRRGRPRKVEAIAERMRLIDRTELDEMKEVEMEVTFGAARSTCRLARKRVQAEINRQIFRQFSPDKC